MDVPIEPVPVEMVYNARETAICCPPRGHRTLDYSREESIYGPQRNRQGDGTGILEKVTIYQEKRQQRETEDRIKKDSAIK